MRIELGREGAERLWLAARLRENGGLIRRPVSWTVRRVDPLSGAAGTFVFSADRPIADVRLPPGEYEVDVRYGYRHTRRRVRIGSGQFVAMTFNLQVGGVRVMTKLQDIGPVRDVRAEQRYFALSGKGRGRLVARTTVPGKLLRLGAGDYRIESRFRPGNARAVARVRVRPGVLSTLSITASAGWARIEPADARSRWLIRDAEGVWRHEGRGAASVVLAPGTYVVEMKKDGGGRVRRFSIAAGERRILRPGRE